MKVPVLTVRAAAFAAMTDAGEERALKDRFQPTINALAARPLAPDEFHVRGMAVCNSERDYYYSRFTEAALSEVAALLPGRPVMVGHDYHGLPVGRFFHAERTLRPQGKKPERDCHWVEGLFYVPKDEEGDAVVRRIDSGIFREVSLGWQCAGATCSVCGHEIMDRQNCPHVPGELYEQGLCEFAFTGITHVMEASLVFAGGQKGTQTFIPAERGLGAVDLLDGTEVPRWDLIAAKKRVLASPVERVSQMRTAVQSVVCAKSRFDAASEASAWVRDHDFRADKTDENSDAYRFRQFDPGECSDDSFRTIELDTGVAAVICKKKQRQRVLSLEEFLAHAD